LIVGMERDAKIAEKVYYILRKEVESREPPNRIWLTDTVYCGRKKIFRMMGVGERFTEVQLNKIWLGLIVGKALEDIGIAKEVEVEYRGIRGKIDTLNDTGEPVEIKVVQNLFCTTGKYTEAHVEQLSRYCLAVNCNSGILFYYIPGMAITEMPSIKYTFDLEKVRAVTDERIDKLLMAQKIMEPYILPPTWHSDNFNNWECKNCTFLGACKSESKPI